MDSAAKQIEVTTKRAVPAENLDFLRGVKPCRQREKDRERLIDALEAASEKFGSSPDQTQIDRWISELPKRRLDELKEAAILVFEGANDAYLEEALLASYASGRTDEIIRQIRFATSFWRNLPGNLAIGVASSFAFVLLLVLA